MKSSHLNRRQVLQLGSAAFCTAALTQSALGTPAAPTKKILYFTKSSGFQHSVVARPDGKLSHSERILVEIGKRHGFDITPSKDGRVFDDAYQDYDAFVFYTSGDLTKVGREDNAPAMSKAGKANLLNAVKQGKGFLGIHAATDCFRAPGTKIDPYIAMVGGEFVGHGAQQKAHMTVVTPKFPGFHSLGSDFVLHEEWYAMKKFAQDMHVLLIQETDGMEGEQYDRPPFPGTWARQHGKGKVFYTSLGHREDVWTNPIFESIVVGALQWVTGEAACEIPTNIGEVTPEANARG